MRILVDTHYLIAIINPRDQWHQSALKILEALNYPSLVVTRSVLIETLNYFSAFHPDAKRHAAESIIAFSVNREVEVIEQARESFDSAVLFYLSRLDKGYSLTDCISMNVCREMGLTDVLTHDRHFEQEGFNVLL